MHTTDPSPFLGACKERLREAITALSRRYDYISVLGTDSKGSSFRTTGRERRVAESMWTERGFVFRAQKDGRIVEYALNELPGGDLPAALAAALDGLLAGAAQARRYPSLSDEDAGAVKYGQVGSDPFAVDAEEILSRLDAARAAMMISPEIVYGAANAEFVRVRKMFLSPRRDLEQGFIWSQAYLVGISRRGDVSKQNYEAFSGLKGLEILDELQVKSKAFAEETLALLDAERLVPGEYDVVVNPVITGLIAHEAFGHGMEMDMFVKGRALAPEYMGKPVASPIVNMYDGALGVEHCGSFLFDDEGSFGSTTQIIKDGILMAGISDLQSALYLGTTPTGNGRRQAFDHKAYARMTNTYIGPGSSTVEEMIASVKHGYYLEKMNSGMEDPKNWGIQLVQLLGKEIRDRTLKGQIVSPVVVSCYVP